MTSVILPQALNDFKNCFGVTSDKEVVTLISNPDKLSPSQAIIWKYSGGALFTGRPLNSTIIMMAGATGAGKSSTINALFNDDTLCKVNDLESETSRIALIRKPLEICKETPSVLTTLNFVDVPGTFDTNAENEKMNEESIRRFKSSRIELSNRKEIPRMFRAYYNITQNVYPNLVLFVVNGTDNRMGGRDSKLMTTLKKLKKTGGDLIDPERNNLIVVLTHVVSISPKPSVFEKGLQQKKDVIREAVKQIFGISDVAIIPIENKPDNYDLAKTGDYYQLPNGEWSHLNLFEAMQECLNRNQDLLARLSIAWYYNSDCPDRPKKAEVIDTHSAEITDDEESALQLTQYEQSLSINANDLPCQLYNVQCLGYGFCPATEQIKPLSPLHPVGNPEVAEIGNSKFRIPAGMSVLSNPMTRFHKLAFLKKRDYEKHMQHSYGLDARIKLVISARSDGNWIEQSSSSEQLSCISVVHETQVATLRLQDPVNHPKLESFQKALTNLPKEYKEETAAQFREFFSRWGTYLIYEQGLGGSIQLKCMLKKAKITEKNLEDIQSSIWSVFAAIFNADGNHKYSNKTETLRDIGIVEQHLQISGGTPPPLITLDTMDSEKLQQWAESVASKPSELRHSMKLYPYYNLIKGKKRESLRQATEEYLKTCLQEKTEEELNQNKIADGNLENVLETPTRKDNNCFPRGTQVYLNDGTVELIENLGQCDIPRSLASLRVRGYGQKLKLCGPSETKFCTYLDKKPNQKLEYICLHFSNGKILQVSPGHVIFQYLGNEQLVIGKQAKHFQVGDRMVYQGVMAGDTMVEYPMVNQISREYRIGAYSPLTSSGTFLANGFFVSSYADTDYFQLGQVSLAPLKLYRNLLPVKNSLTEMGIHPYAKFLISVRKAVTFYKRQRTDKKTAKRW